MTRLRSAIAPLLVGGWALLSGCGLLVNSTHQTIVVASEPSGAEVRSGPRELQYWTPALVTLPRKHAYLLTFELPGYRTASFEIRHRINPRIVVGDILLTAGLGMVVDGLTGSWYELAPKRAFVTLEASDGPERVAVALGMEGDAVQIVSSRPGVVIRVYPR
ncbi:MAG: hypothetical protein HY700_19585 [Gemmatimonadetes bacterium]|nr:hypothetical protein [Gemmatimonadota bacterium]